MISRTLGVVLLGLTLPLTAAGDCFAPVVITQQTTVFTTPVVATFIPLVVPAYSVTYSDPSAGLKAEIDALRAELQELKAPGRLKMPAAAEAAPNSAQEAFSVLKDRCASCHDKTTAKAKGKGFVLLDGDNVAELDAAAALTVCLKTMAGEMPPGRPLTEAEKKTLAGLFVVKK